MFNNHTMSSYQDEVLTAQQWREFIAQGRSDTQRKAGNNTIVHVINDGQDVAIKLHDTDIIVLNANGTITLNSGGWQTVTTKERINKYTNAGISQRAGTWYMKDGSLFYDGATIKQDGTPLKPRPTAKYEQQLKKIKKLAKQYARDYVEALKAGAIDYPNGGDCWACLMKGPEGQKTFPGSRHIQSHIEEKYFVPSLLVNAGRDAGYRDEQIGLMGIGGQRVFIEPERVIYKYVVKQLQKEL